MQQTKKAKRSEELKHFFYLQSLNKLKVQCKLVHACNSHQIRKIQKSFDRKDFKAMGDIDIRELLFQFTVMISGKTARGEPCKLKRYCFILQKLSYTFRYNLMTHQL